MTNYKNLNDLGQIRQPAAGGRRFAAHGPGCSGLLAGGAEGAWPPAGTRVGLAGCRLIGRNRGPQAWKQQLEQNRDGTGADRFSAASSAAVQPG